MLHPQLVELLVETSRCGLGGGGVSPGVGWPSLCLLPVHQDVKLSAAALAPCLSDSHRDDHGLTL